MNKDYYKTLGIDKSASKDDVKTAFRKLAHQYHPDKGTGNETKFKEVSEAYSVLGDDKKREQYDRFGSAGPTGGGGGSYGGNYGGFSGQDFGGFDFSQFTQGGNGGGVEFDLGDIFGEFFGGGGSAGWRKRVRKGQDITVDLEITFSESVFGVEKEFSLTKNHSPKAEKIKVKVPADINNGETIRLRGAGETIPDGQPGDLYISISVRPDPLFQKAGKNILTEINIKLSDALLGMKYPLKTLDGDIELKVPEGINNGEMLRVKDKGVPIDSRHRGDLLVKVKIKMPSHLSRSAKKLIEDLKKEGI